MRNKSIVIMAWLTRLIRKSGTKFNAAGERGSFMKAGVSLSLLLALSCSVVAQERKVSVPPVKLMNKGGLKYEIE